MKLTRVEIKNYRSLIHDYDHQKSFDILLGDGVNAITGPNNAGKSNILRALSLALDPEFEFNRYLDIPAGFNAVAKPAVTLTFQVPLTGAAAQERKLLRLLGEYEQQVNPGKAGYSAAGEVRLRVTIEGGDEDRGERRRAFVVKGVGARQLSRDDPAMLAALNQFDRCLQFVLIRSGESLESLLQGRFREVLQSVLRDELKADYDKAGQARQEYISALQHGVLANLKSRIATELGDLFPEVSAVELEPNVRALDDTLTSMRVLVADRATTDLADKGTGVRGGLIVAMLQHLANTSKKSIVFAVEEPESFLHPAAQEALRDDLESLAERSDVSVLITTHSPYVISRRSEAQVISIQKDASGRTCVHDQKRGNEPMQEALGGLFRSSLFVGFLDHAARARSDEKAVLVVEGETDRDWIVHAAHISGRPELLDCLTIEVAGGALAGVVQALLLQATSEHPVAVLFDNDKDGKNALALMKGFNEKTKVWAEGKRVYSYRMVLNPGDHEFEYEAEDLWPEQLHTRFLKTVDENEHLAEKRKRPNPLGGFHFGYANKAKAPFSEFVLQKAKPGDCAKWVELLQLIRTGLGI